MKQLIPMKFTVSILIAVTLLLSSCATYFMTPQGLQTALENKKVNKEGSTRVKCVDKDGNAFILTPTNHTGIRITKKDGSSQVFYFVTAYLSDSLIMGSKSTFLNFPIKPIKITEIKKIELDGQ